MPPAWWRITITLAVIPLALSACGGGDSGPDTAPPTVGTTSPADAATGVSRATIVTASFDEDILATSVDAGSFTLQDSLGAVAGTVAFDGDTNVATFIPSQPLGLVRDYTATLTTAITDLSGNALVSDYTWSFTTRDNAWLVAQIIESESGNAYAPEIAVDADGNAIAIWRQWGGSGYDVWVNRYRPAIGWQTAEKIDDKDSGNTASLAIGLDPAGNALAVWAESDGTRDNIWSNRYTVGGGWGSPELIESDDSGSAESPRVAVDAAGNAVAVWYQSDGLRTSIWANRYTAGAGWGTAALIETDDTGYALEPRVAVDAAGNALAVWRQADGARWNVWANRYTTGVGWGTAVVIETNNGGTGYPQIAMDSAGNAMAVWDQWDGAAFSIWANRFTPGGGWGTAALIESDNSGPASSAQVAVDDSGSALAVWIQSDGTHDNVWANRFTPAAGWGTATLIESDGAGDARDARIVVDAAGNGLAVWDQGDGAVDNVVANRFSPAGGWGIASALETNDSGDARHPQIAVDSLGNALAVWQQSDGIHQNILANRFK